MTSTLRSSGRDPALAEEHLLERTDRDLDLIERRLPRGQPLEPEAGREQRHQNRVLLVLAGKADQLVGEPGDHRQQQDRLVISQYHAGWPTNAKTKIPITITQSKKAVPQRG